MSKEAVRLFIEKVEQDEKLQSQVLAAFETNQNVSGLGRQQGFEFTEEEGYEVWEEVQGEDELSDFALELVAGGLPINCSTGSNQMS